MTNAAVQPPARGGFPWKRGLLAVLLALILIAAGWVVFPSTRTEFPLKEVPTPEELYGEPLFSGPTGRCRKDPFDAVRKYPQFVSSAPLYGEVALDSNGSAGTSLVTCYFALDESKGDGSGYDTLYFDVNANLDLTDDAPRVATDRTPDGAMICFEHVTLPWNYGPGIERVPLGFEPRLSLRGGPNQAWLCLQHLWARQGKIRAGGLAYDVTLVRARSASGRYDEGDTWVRTVRPWQLLLFRGGHIAGSRGPDTNWFHLKEMMHVRNTWYRLSAAPLGDKLFVNRYDGDTGVLQIGAGGRPVAVRMSGLLVSRDAACRLGTSDDEWPPCPYADRAELPVGDYSLELCELEVGPLRVDILGNINSDGVPRDRKNHPPRYFVEIRKDKPFTFELLTKPDVLFASPAKDARVKPGDTLSVNASLLDTAHDLALSQIYDSRRKVTIGGFPMAAPLTAEVKILDSSGNLVTGGNLPLHNLAYPGFKWVVPDTFQPKDSRETLTITVTYDTLELFGRIESSREIIVYDPEAR